jgi:copper chaperone CopZ
MKKYILLLTTIIITISATAQFTKASLQASGLTCAMCSKAVKVALEKVSFVQEVKVDIKNQEYAIVFRENTDVDFDLLKKAVEDAGFSVASLKITCTFSGLSIEKDKHVQIGGKNFHFLNGKDDVLNGERIITIVDKDFLSAKEFKKQSVAYKKECVQTGKTGSCCLQEGIAAGARVYHVTI